MATTKEPRLLQETLERGPLYGWRVLVCCAVLNRCHGSVAKDILDEVLRRWPTPGALAIAGPDLERVIARLGLAVGRAANLRNLSCDYDRGLRPPLRIRGCGRYAEDAWRLFVEQDPPPTCPDDGHLARYWRRLTGRPPKAESQVTSRQVVEMALAHGVAAVRALEPRPGRKVIGAAAARLREIKRGDVADELVATVKRRGDPLLRFQAGGRWSVKVRSIKGAIVAQIRLDALGSKAGDLIVVKARAGMLEISPLMSAPEA
jgi:hypothetical protein